MNSDCCSISNGSGAHFKRGMAPVVALMTCVTLGLAGSAEVRAEPPLVNVPGSDSLELVVGQEPASAPESTPRENGGANIDLVSPESDASDPVGSMTAGTKGSAGADPAPAADVDVASSSVGVPPVQRSVAAPGAGSASATAAP
jgi:hypothetical protein